MQKKRFLYLLVTLLVISLFVTVVACGKKEEPKQKEQQGQANTAEEKPVPTKTLKAGFILSTSGPLSTMSASFKKAIDVYTELINNDGGVKIGDEYYKIQMEYATDEDGAPEKTVQAARLLIENKGVQAILGYFNNYLPALANVTNPAKVVLISTKPVNYDPATMPYTAFSYTDNLLVVPQVTSTLKWFKDTKTLGISVVDVGLPSLEPQLPGLNELLDERGIKLVMDTYAQATTDYTQHVEKLKASGADTVYSWAWAPQEAIVIKNAYQANAKMNWSCASPLLDLKEWIDLTGYDAAQGTLHGDQRPWEMSGIPQQTLDKVNWIREGYKEKYGEEMNDSAPFEYSLGSMEVYLQALQKAGTTDPDAVMKSIEGGTFELFIGTFTMSGKKTFGRAVMAGTTGGLGVIEGYNMRQVVTSPLNNIP